MESTRLLLGQRSKRSIPNTVDYNTLSLMKDGVPSENSEVGITFLCLDQKFKSNHKLNSTIFNEMQNATSVIQI